MCMLMAAAWELLHVHVCSIVAVSCRMNRYFAVDRKKGPLPSDALKKLWNQPDGRSLTYACRL